MLNKKTESALDVLAQAINEFDLHKIMALYDTNAILIPTVQQTIIRGLDDIRGHYNLVLQNNDFTMDILNSTVDYNRGNTIIVGTCLATWIVGEKRQHSKSRVSLLLQNDKILIHHSS